MGNITLIGVIDSVKYLPNSGGGFVFLSEYKHGYKKSNGEVVDDKYLSWKCVFKDGLSKYINQHFSKGMVVEIKGEAFPYAIEHDRIVEGYSVILQTINMFSVPRTMLRMEQRMQKDSQLHASEKPDLEGFCEDDF